VSISDCKQAIDTKYQAKFRQGPLDKHSLGPQATPRFYLAVVRDKMWEWPGDEAK